MKPQTARVLAQLRRGPVTAGDFDLPNVIDGQPPILRLASRIYELKAAGCVIVKSFRKGSPLAVYTLLSEPQEDAPRTVGRDEAVDGFLFDADPFQVAA